MRRIALRLAATVSLLLAGAVLPYSSPAARAQGGVPVHAFLFGAWTGGLFPPPSTVTAQQCLAAPTIIFARDLVLRLTFTDLLYIQRIIETARGTGSGWEFRFAPVPTPAGSQTMPGMAGAADEGFGCDSPDVLRVQRLTANEISFPGCKVFPYKLVRCPAG